VNSENGIALILAKLFIFMKNDVMVWVDCAKWRDRWNIVESLPSGGQGESFRVRRKVDGRIAFLKTIKAKTDPERRARFFREANAYDTFHIEMVPRLIESNAHRHDNCEFQPYLATEFIEGPTLRKWRAAQSRVELTVAVATTRSLLQTIRNCHAVGCVHRDIKPDNIIQLATARPRWVGSSGEGTGFSLRVGNSARAKSQSGFHPTSTFAFADLIGHPIQLRVDPTTGALSSP
jgi:hypothetical protein